jgi:aspartyl-tRNA synthetase
MKAVDFKVFRAAADLPNGRVAALCVPGGGTLSRKEIDDYTAFVAIYGARGLAYIKVNDVTQVDERGLQSPIVKFLSPGALAQILERTVPGMATHLSPPTARGVNDALARCTRVGHDRGLAGGGGIRLG